MEEQITSKKQDANSDGELIRISTGFEGTNAENTFIFSVFKKKSGNVYYLGENGTRYNGSLTFSYADANYFSKNVIPGQYVYTGVTVGGITTGGVYKTKDRVKYNSYSSGKGYISFNLGGMETKQLLSIEICNDFVKDIAKRYFAVKENMVEKDGRTFIRAYTPAESITTTMSGMSQEMLMQAIQNDYINQGMNKQYADSIIEFLNYIINTPVLETDEELYKKAIEYSNSNNLDDLKKAKYIFKLIGYYGDSLIKAEEVRVKIEHVKSVYRIKIIIAILMVMMIGLAIYSVTVIIPQKRYQKIETYYASGNYELVIEKIGNRKDEDKMKDIYYSAVKKLVEQYTDEGEYEKAINLYESEGLNDWDLLEKPSIALADEKCENEEYKEAYEIYCKFGNHGENYAKCCLNLIKQYNENKEYSKAAECLKNAYKGISYNDDIEKDEFLVLMYDYIKSHYDINDDYTWSFISTLCSEEYEDAIAIRKDLAKPVYTFYLGNKETDNVGSQSYKVTGKYLTIKYEVSKLKEYSDGCYYTWEITHNDGTVSSGKKECYGEIKSASFNINYLNGAAIKEVITIYDETDEVIFGPITIT